MYEAVRGFFRGRKEDIIAVALSITGYLVVFGIGYMYGLKHAGTPAGSSIPNNGNGIVTVGEHISTAQSNQHEITDGLNSAIGRGDSISERSDAIKERADTAANDVRTAGELISECQQIVGRIRNRGQAGTPSH